MLEVIIEKVEKVIEQSKNMDLKGHDVSLVTIDRVLNDVLSATKNMSKLKNKYDNAEDLKNDKDYLEVEKEFVSKIRGFKDDSITIQLGSNCWYCGEMMSGIKINLITGEAELEEMVEKEPMEFNLDENGSVLSIKKDGVYGFETANQCKFRSTEYVETTLEIEKDLVFVNYFKQDDTMYLKDLITHQMHYAIGRERVKKEIASKDVVLGSNSNVSLYLYQKANKIVILNMNIQDEEFEEFQKPKLKPLELNQYEEYKNWAYRGTIVSEVGDYMATSSKNMDKRRLSSDQFNEPVKLDLENGNYKQIDYNAVKYNGLVISTIEKTL